jgi:hypothetical protein
LVCTEGFEVWVKIGGRRVKMVLFQVLWQKRPNNPSSFWLKRIVVDVLGALAMGRGGEGLWFAARGLRFE